MKRLRKEEFLVSTSARHYNQTVKSFMLVCMSLMALMSGMNRTTWAMLTAVGALLFLTGRREAQASSSAQYQSAAGYRHAVLWCTRSLARRSDLAYR